MKLYLKNRMNQIANLLTRISKECFSDKQRKILEFEEDDLVVSVEDQLFLHFYDLFPRYEEEVLVRKFRAVVMENRHIILQIKEAKEYAFYNLTNSEKLVDIEKTTYDTLDDTHAEQKGENTTLTDVKQTSINEDKSETISLRSTLGRNASTETSKLEENVENWDENRELKTKIGRQIDKTLQIDADDIKSTLINKVNNPEVVNDVENKNLPYNAFDLSVAKSKDHSFNESLGIGKTFTDSKNNTSVDLLNTNLLKKTGTVTLEKSNPATASKTVLELQIPNLYSRFWRCFYFLFDTKPNLC